ncbi:MAG: response regulator [Lachnospiraceae bacterium]|nr:response regulator [Lachnospiraceae bacterium]
MFRIAICDDDNEFIDYVKEILDSLGLTNNTVFYEYNNGETFLLDLEIGLNLDLLILDIQMDGINGNEVAICFRKACPNTTLVFCTGIYQPSPEIIKVHPFRFILKQYSKQKMQQEFSEIVSYLKEIKEVPIISGYNAYDHYQVNVDKVMYISISKRGSIIHLCEGAVADKNISTINCKRKVKELYEILKNYNFVYAHNSYIVNLRYVKSRRKDELQLMNGEILSVSRAKTKEVREKMALYLEKKYI